jgi:hypothetical protein
MEHRSMECKQTQTERKQQTWRSWWRAEAAGAARWCARTSLPNAPLSRDEEHFCYLAVLADQAAHQSRHRPLRTISTTTCRTRTINNGITSITSLHTRTWRTRRRAKTAATGLNKFEFELRNNKNRE